MKILVCSKFFYPSNKIGAVRPSNFTKYLALFGYKVVVITDIKEIDREFNLSNVEIIRISSNKTLEKLVSGIGKKIISQKNKKPILVNPDKISGSKFKRIVKKIKSRIKYYFFEMYFLINDIDWYLTSRRYIHHNYSSSSFDFVLSSYGPLSSFLLGSFVKHKKIASYWISDYRDNMRNERYSFFLNHYMKICEKRALMNADAITFVSKDQKSMFEHNLKVNDVLKEKIYTLYNGFESETNKNNYKKTFNNKFRILYTGQLYKGIRDFSLLFHVLDDLISEGAIDKKRIEIQYAGNDTNELYLQLSKFKNITNICTNFGFVDRNKALQLQEECNILIVLTWNTNKSLGNLTGKFLEYLKVKKPIISLTTGDLPNGELTRLVRELNIGIACEYCNYKSDYLKLKHYLISQYNLHSNNNELDFNPNNILIKKFEYKNISKKLLAIIESTTKKYK